MRSVDWLWTTYNSLRNYLRYRNPRPFIRGCPMRAVLGIDAGGHCHSRAAYRWSSMRERVGTLLPYRPRTEPSMRSQPENHYANFARPVHGPMRLSYSRRR